MAISRSNQGGAGKKTGAADFVSRIIVGGKGQGKSTKAKLYLADFIKRMSKEKSWKNNDVHPRGLIHDYSGSRAFEQYKTLEEFAYLIEKTHRVKLKNPLDVIRLKTKDGKPLWKRGILRHEAVEDKDIEEFHRMTFKYFKNGLVILDECNTYYHANPTSWQKRLLVNHRNKGLEVIYIFHALKKIPTFISDSEHVFSYDILKTGEKITAKQFERFGVIDYKMEEAYRKVCRYPKTDNFLQPHETVLRHEYV